jgi:FG-GAP-like repeat
LVRVTQALLLGDLNRDGKLDVVVIGRDTTESSSKVALLLGNGDGTMQSAQKYDVVGIAAAGALADFNRDGALDVAAVGQNTPAVSILLNTGAH